MKVILQQDVARLGKKFTEVEVADGYALNRLIPGGMAVPANKTNRGRLATFTNHIAESQIAAEEQLRLALGELESKPLALTANANEQGGLFQAVEKEMVLAAATARNLNLEAVNIIFPKDAIKQLGEYTITLSAGSLSEDIQLHVVAKDS